MGDDEHDSDSPVRRAGLASTRRQFLGAAALAVVGSSIGVGASTATGTTPIAFEPRSLDGSANNLVHPRWGEVGSSYRRLARARYEDGVQTMAGGPNPRYISNRVFNSLGVDVFSERNLSQLAWVWGQSIDHTIGFAQTGSENAAIAFDGSDPLETFTSGYGGMIPFTRDAAASGTATDRGNPRMQVNTVNAYVDAWIIYGGTEERLRWLRNGPRLMLPGGYLPTATARGDAGSAPAMQIKGQLAADPQSAFVSGDVRANENAGITAMHTLLAREHNRIVDLLPASLADELRFQIARRVIGATQQYITYTEFLPAMGVDLPRYRGYDPSVRSELYDEFATVGYRMHSMVNGEVDLVVDAGEYTPTEQAALTGLGIQISPIAGAPGQLELTIPQSTMFFNPEVLPAVGLDAFLSGLAGEPGYKNDEQVDDSLRSELFEMPISNVPVELVACLADVTGTCFQGVVDLAAIDIQRGRDNGMPTYNELRRALGLAPARSFTDITGEATEEFPQRLGIDNPASMLFTALWDLYGNRVSIYRETSSGARPVRAERASALAARLKASYGSVDAVDAFVGMLSEPHVAGSELGEVQRELWSRQFAALRDGDRFFYLNDPVLETIEARYGVTYRHTLRDLILMNTSLSPAQLQANVFFAPPPADAAPQAPAPPPGLTFNDPGDTADLGGPQSLPAPSGQGDVTGLGGGFLLPGG